MVETSTLVVRLPNETKAKLDRLANLNRTTGDVLAGEAVTGYVERELAVIEAIERGRQDIRAGRGTGTDDVFREVEALIADAEAARARQ